MHGRLRQRGAAFVVAAAFVVTAVAVVTETPVTTAAEPDTSAFVPVGPIRLADTRQAACGCTRTSASTIRVAVAGLPSIPDDVIAAAITVTALPTESAGFVTVFPAGEAMPATSTLNTRNDRVVANSTIVPLGADGALDVFHLLPGALVVDITGVFVRVDEATAGRFVPTESRRLADTRTAANGASPLTPGSELTVALPAGVADDATALVVNVTSLADSAPGFLSIRPAGTPLQTTSFLNTNGSGQVTAASVITPTSSLGVTIYSHGGGHLIVDVIGWFTGPTSPSGTDGLFRPISPTRLLDTRATEPRIHSGGTIELGLPFTGVSAIVSNVTSTLADRPGFVTAFPARTAPPGTSTLNPAFFEHTVANLAITRASNHGLAYRSHAGTDLIVDATGVFTGAPVTASGPLAPNTPTRSRVLMVGDSTLAGLDVYTDSHIALRGFDWIIDAESCRRLVRPSCFSSETGRVPNTVVEAILTTPGDLDVVVVKGGYNDWFSDFPGEFGAVVNAARAKGAHTIIWFTLNERVSRARARLAYETNNEALRWLTQLPQYGDVVLADWHAYSDDRQDWFHDGTHVRRAGAYAITDYTARWIAAREHRPCPRPWTVGGPTFDPCPPPDLIGAVGDPIAVSQ